MVKLRHRIVPGRKHDVAGGVDESPALFAARHRNAEGEETVSQAFVDGFVFERNFRGVVQIYDTHFAVFDGYDVLSEYPLDLVVFAW